MQQKVILIGPGNVGITFIQQVLEKDVISIGHHNNPTVIVGVIGMNEFLFNPYGLPDQVLANIIETRQLGPTAIKINNMSEIITQVKHTGLNGEVIFVDASSGKEDIRDFHLDIIEKSDNGIVTANKNPLSLYNYDIYKRLTKNLRYQYTTTVMAGSGIVRFLRGTRKISDQIKSISGMFSGTLGYITSELDKERNIDEVVKSAYELKYTEPHPWDDLNGLDVARKLIILGRSAGFPLNMEDIKIEPLLPTYLGDIKNITDFLEAIKQENANMAKKVAEAKSRHNVLRYVASLENKNNKLNLSVGLKEVPADSPLGRLSGPTNLVEVITDIYNEQNPYILMSPGAGLEVTAGSLRKDLLSFLPILENNDIVKGK